MKEIYSLLILFTFAFALNINAENQLSHELEEAIKNEKDNELYKQDAKRIIKQFILELKPILKTAIQSGGFEHAIKICSVEAPHITKKLSQKTGWNVKRVSLKARNSVTAIPDEWEAKVLKDFNLKQSEGLSAKSLNHYERINYQFRYMQAQDVEPICMNCHGKQISPSIFEILKRIYPNDMARGYSLGEIRGAISLTKRLPINSGVDR